MKKIKRKNSVKRKPPLPKLMDTTELCKNLLVMAAFAPHDNPKVQEQVYTTVRQLRLLDQAAIEAGILSR